MIRFLRSLLFSPSQKVPNVAPKRLGINLSAIVGALVEEKGFPRPQWEIIQGWINTHVSKEDLSGAWQEAAFDWLSELQGHLGADYSVHQSANFLLLTSRGPSSSKSILGTCESAVLLLTNWLGKIAEKRGYGKHVILDFASRGSYYDYVSYFYPPGAPLIASGGIFLGGGYQHIALPPANSTQDALIHELTHNRLSHLRLPLWLEEGIAVTMERRIGGKKHGMLDRELQRKHHNYWTKETIAAFWAGSSFKNIDGKVIHLSYSLAEILVDLLVQEFANFMEFVARADRKDAGQAASADVLGVSLNDIVSTFLGPGEWAPEKSQT